MSWNEESEQRFVWYLYSLEEPLFGCQTIIRLNYCMTAAVLMAGTENELDCKWWSVVNSPWQTAMAFLVAVLLTDECCQATIGVDVTLAAAYWELFEMVVVLKP
jgi:hypothetical protein